MNVDTTALPAPIQRLGLQFNIRKDLQQVIYKGNGPHECYPVSINEQMGIFILYYIDTVIKYIHMNVPTNILIIILIGSKIIHYSCCTQD